MAKVKKHNVYDIRELLLEYFDMVMLLREEKEKVGKIFVHDKCLFTPNGEVFWSELFKFTGMV